MSGWALRFLVLALVVGAGATARTPLRRRPIRAGARGGRRRATATLMCVSLTVLAGPPAAAAIHLRSPERTAVDQTFQVHWSGDVRGSDYLTIVPAHAPPGRPGAYLPIDPTRQQAALRAPHEPGTYALRLVTGDRAATLAERLFDVTPPHPAAGLVVPARVTAGGRFAVTWHGPRTPGDFIALLDLQNHTLERAHFTGHDDRLVLHAPSETGRYEVHYVAGDETLARASLRVVRAG